MAALILDILSKNTITTIHFHPCNPVLLSLNTGFILLCEIFLSYIFVYLVVFGNIMCKLEK